MPAGLPTKNPNVSQFSPPNAVKFSRISRGNNAQSAPSFRWIPSRKARQLRSYSQVGVPFTCNSGRRPDRFGKYMPAVDLGRISNRICELDQDSEPSGFRVRLVKAAISRRSPPTGDSRAPILPITPHLSPGKLAVVVPAGFRYFMVLIQCQWITAETGLD